MVLDLNFFIHADNQSCQRSKEIRLAGAVAEAEAGAVAVAEAEAGAGAGAGAGAVAEAVSFIQPGQCQPP